MSTERTPREELLSFLNDLLIIGEPVKDFDGNFTKRIECRLWKPRVEEIIKIVEDNVLNQEVIP